MYLSFCLHVCFSVRQGYALVYGLVMGFIPNYFLRAILQFHANSLEPLNYARTVTSYK